MKYIKTYKIFENSNSDLISKLKKFRIKNYTINDDGSIDIDDDVNLSDKKLNEIPFNFHNVSGNFDCSFNELTSLEGSPTEIGNYFNCSFNRLTSLEYCPSEIRDNFYCSYNKLTMLDCSSYIKGDIICWGMFEQEPEFFGDCEGEINWNHK